MSRTYTIIKPDGIQESVTVRGKASLEQLQSWVGGYIQMVRILPKQWIVVNDEGRINGMPLNPHMRWNGEPLFGPIVMLPRGCRS